MEEVAERKVVISHRSRPVRQVGDFILGLGYTQGSSTTVKKL